MPAHGFPQLKLPQESAKATEHLLESEIEYGMLRALKQLQRLTFTVNSLPIILYGVETWTVCMSQGGNLNNFHLSNLWKILKDTWQEKISDNEELNARRH